MEKCTKPVVMFQPCSGESCVRWGFCAEHGVHIADDSGSVWYMSARDWLASIAQARATGSLTQRRFLPASRFPGLRYTLKEWLAFRAAILRGDKRLIEGTVT